MVFCELLCIEFGVRVFCEVSHLVRDLWYLCVLHWAGDSESSHVRLEQCDLRSRFALWPHRSGHDLRETATEILAQCESPAARTAFRPA